MNQDNPNTTENDRPFRAGDDAFMDGILQELARGGPADHVDEHFVARVMKSLNKAVSAQPVRPLRIKPWTRAVLALAATALIIAGAIFWNQQHVTPASSTIARIASASPQVMLLRSQTTTPISTGQHLQNNDRLELNNGEQVRMEGLTRTGESDGTQFQLWGPASMTIRDEGSARILILDKGTLDAQVAKRDPDSPLRIQTPHALATIVGTRFSMQVDADASRLDVEEGAVRLEKNGESILVTAGNAATADSDDMKSTHGWVSLIPDPSQPLRYATDTQLIASAWSIGTNEIGRYIRQDRLTAFASGNLKVIAPTKAGIIEGEVLVRGAAGTIRTGWVLCPSVSRSSPTGALGVVGAAFTPEETPVGQPVKFRVCFQLHDGGNLVSEVFTSPAEESKPSEPRHRTTTDQILPDIHSFNGISMWCDQTAVEFRNLRYRPTP